YNSINDVSAEMVKLLYDFRQAPKKYLTVKVSLFWWRQRPICVHGLSLLFANHRSFGVTKGESRCRVTPSRSARCATKLRRCARKTQGASSSRRRVTSL